MDIISHALLGHLIGIHANKRNKIAATIFAAAPDFFQIPLYGIVGYFGNKPYLIPENGDWIGFRTSHPIFSLLWEIPHGLWMLILVGIIARKLNLHIWLMIAAYGSHLATDMYTHTGEWAMKPFWPIQITVSGVNDMWAWEFGHFAISWLVLVSPILLINAAKKSKPVNFDI